MKSKLLSVLVNKLQVGWFFFGCYVGPVLFERYILFFFNGNLIFTMVNSITKKKKHLSAPSYSISVFFLCFKCLCAFLFAVL